MLNLYMDKDNRKFVYTAIGQKAYLVNNPKEGEVWRFETEEVHDVKTSIIVPWSEFAESKVYDFSNAFDEPIKTQGYHDTDGLYKNDEEIDFNVDIKMQDAVNHPSHYTNGKIECIDAIESAVTGLNGFESYCIGNAIKYLFRWKNKGGTVDLEKSVWYINKVLEKNK